MKNESIDQPGGWLVKPPEPGKGGKIRRNMRHGAKSSCGKTAKRINLA
jgi:hypothetical protein